MLKNSNVKNLKETSDTNRKVVVFIPVRGGSKSIPLKNIHLFNGKPLVYWVLEAAQKCEYIKLIYVSTEDERIKKTIESFLFSKVIVIDRSKETATDEASTELVMLEFSSKFEFDDVVLIQATSPLLTSRDLQHGIEKYYREDVDSLLSVVRQKRFLWKEKDDGTAQPTNYNPVQRPRRQEWDGYFVENGAFYITSKIQLEKSHCRISGDIAIYEMDESSYFEIDEPADWSIAEALHKRYRLPDTMQLIDFDRINLLICDVDGVLTDAGMYYSDSYGELKKFNTRDGKGIELLRQAGVKIMFLTSEDTAIVRRRAEKLHVDYLFMGILNKKEFLMGFFSNHPEFNFDTIAYIGDDVNDLDCIKSALFSACPQDGNNAVKTEAGYICYFTGGSGCVREVCDLILLRRTNG